MRRLVSLVIGIGLVAAGTLVALAALEAGFRIYAWFHPSTAKTFFWVPSLDYGWGLAPGREGPFFSDQGEFSTRPHINSHGLRDVEHQYAKDVGVYRILILGDSYMEALQVNLEQMFARQLSGHLKARGARRVEVISAGVSSWGTDNELLFLRHEGYKYQPDLILLAFTTANDIRENYEPFNRMALRANLTKPFFTFDEKGALEMHPPAIPAAPPVPWWRQDLYVGQFLSQWLGARVILPDQHVGIPPPKDPKVPYVPADILVYKPDMPPEVREAWRVTEALVLAVRDEAARHGAQFAMMIINGPWAHDDVYWKFMCLRDPVAAKTWDRQKPNRILDEFLSAQHIRFLDLLSTFEAAKGGEPLFFKADPHWTLRGHVLAAETMAEFLVAQNLVPTDAANVATLGR